MAEKEKVHGESLNRIVGGKSDLDSARQEVVKFCGNHHSGPYKCHISGKDYYLGDEERPRAVCLECWQKPLFVNKNKK